MAKKSKGELRKSIEQDTVYYHMSLGEFILEPRTTRTVQLNDGGFGQVHNETALTLRRDGERRESPYLPPLSPDNPVHAKMIERIDQWISDHPAAADKIGLYRVDKRDIDRPTPSWDDPSMTADKAYSVVLDAGLNVKQAMKYELSKENPREDILDALERVATKLQMDAADKSNEVPVL